MKPISRTIETGQCDSCKKIFDYFLIHNGFNDSAYAYCDRCGKTCCLSAYNAPKGIQVGFGVIASEIEPLLQDCECGGRFRRGSSPRCPHCHIELSASKATKFIEKTALGTKFGWHWQENWQGIYSMVIENNIIEDNWKKTQ